MPQLSTSDGSGLMSTLGALEDVLSQSSTGVPIVIGAIVVLIVAIRTAGSTIRSLGRERTRREIAAYIAEGSMTPEQGERLMKASDPRASE